MRLNFPGAAGTVTGSPPTADSLRPAIQEELDLAVRAAEHGETVTV